MKTVMKRVEKSHEKGREKAPGGGEECSEMGGNFVQTVSDGARLRKGGRTNSSNMKLSWLCTETTGEKWCWMLGGQ